MRGLIEGLLQCNDEKLTIEEMFKDGCWNWKKLSFVFLSTIKEKINAIPIPLFGESKDFIRWKYAPNGEFSMASAYKLAKLEEGQIPEFSGKWIWKLDTVPKIVPFLWLCHHKSVPVRETIAARGVECDITCPVSKNAVETLSHALRESPFALDFWRKIKTPVTLQASFQLELLDWLKIYCLFDPNIMVNGCPWRIQFPFAVWHLWKHRNRVVFENTTLNMSLHTYCINQFVEYFFYIGEASKEKHYTAVQIRWKKPREGWAKLNIDGASLGNPGRAGSGGILRDHRWMWIKGFARRIGYATSLLAKSWA